MRLEHANMTVRNIDETIRFLMTAFPEFRIRHDGRDGRGSRWVHIGTDETYIALNAASTVPAQKWQPYGGMPGVNHLAYVVDDVEGIRERLRAAGFTDSTVRNNHPHRKRIYFIDPDGNDWEFLQYASADPGERNDYATAE